MNQQNYISHEVKIEDIDKFDFSFKIQNVCYCTIKFQQTSKHWEVKKRPTEIRVIKKIMWVSSYLFKIYVNYICILWATARQ